MADPAVLDRLERLEAELAVLRAERDPANEPERRFGRRHLITAVAGAAAGGVLASAKPASADTGDPLVLGQENTADTETTLEGELLVTGFATEGIWVTSTGDEGNIALLVEGGAIVAFPDPAGVPAVLAANANSSSTIQAGNAVGTAIHAIADRTITSPPSPPLGRISVLDADGLLEPNVAPIEARGGRTHLLLVPRAEAGLPAPTVEHDEGELALDANTDIHVCHEAGTPGAWHKLLTNRASTGAAAGAVHVLDQPFRLHDSRAGQVAALSGPKGKLDDGETITLKVTQTEPLGGGTEIPASALAVLCTIQAIDTTGTGFLRAYRTGGSPVATTLSFTKSQRAITTAYVRLSSTGRMSLRGYNASANVVVDILGWIA